MKKNNKAKFIMIDSSLKGTKEFVVTYDVNGKPTRDFVLVEEKKGLTKEDYLRLAEKKFNANKHNANPIKSSAFIFKVIAGCAGVAAITFASLFTWKMLQHTDLTYNVTWDLGNGQIVQETYKVGEMPSYKDETPSKPDDTEYDEDRMKYHYTFDGWEETISPVAKDVTYHAHYNKESLFFVIKGYIGQEDIGSDGATYHIDELWNAEEETAWDIDWGDGDMSVDHDQHDHTYTTPGYKTIKIHNDCTSLHLNCDDPEAFAFSKKFLKEITLPYGVERIPSSLETGEVALFDSCKMNIVTFPSSLLSMTNIFTSNGMVVDTANIGEIKLPNKLKLIEQYGFTGLYEYGYPLVIPDSVIAVQQRAFFDVGVKRLVLPKSIKSYPSESLDLQGDRGAITFNTIDMTDYDVAPDIVDDTFGDITPEGLYRILVKASAYESFLTKWDGNPVTGLLYVV